MSEKCEHEWVWFGTMQSDQGVEMDLYVCQQTYCDVVEIRKA